MDPRRSGPSGSPFNGLLTWLVAGLAASIAVSLVLRRFVPVFILFLPLFWRRNRPRR